MTYSGDFGIWTQEVNDDLNWQVNSGSTGSFGTGPSSAFDGVNYIYVETSSPAFLGQTATLYNPCVDLTAWNNPSLVFAYHMFGINMGTISKSKYYEYKEYHTSLDDLDFVKSSNILKTLYRCPGNLLLSLPLSFL